MRGYGPSAYGDRIAEIYDELQIEDRDDDAARTQAAVLRELAGHGKALELGVGTGRLALPLSALGVEVVGLDASAAMIARLREKPGASGIRLVLGDLPNIPVEDEFELVYIVFSTFFALLDQADQVQCFANVARRLAPGGAFVLEAFVQDLQRFNRHQGTKVYEVGLERVRLNVERHDPVRQIVDVQHLVISEAGIRLFPNRLRYAWPAELDLMAQLAGLRLRERWGNWHRDAFTADSRQHISIYERA